MDRLALLETFVQVCDASSFSGAANRLGLSRGVVSKHVKQLEDRLGTRLINRTTRRLSLTEAGAAFYERCRQALADLDEAEADAARTSARPRGMLRVNAPMSFGQRYIAPLITPYLAAFPDVAIDLTLNDRVVDLVDEGYDVAIRIGRLPDSSLVARKLASSRMVICASRDHLSAHGTPAHPRDLADRPLLGYTYSSGRDLLRLEGPDGITEVKVRGPLKANNGDVLCTAVEAGLGIVATPAFFVAESLRDGVLVEILSDWSLPSTDIHAVYPGNRYVPAKVRTFVDHLVAAFRPAPPWELAAEATNAA